MSFPSIDSRVATECILTMNALNSVKMLCEVPLEKMHYWSATFASIENNTKNSKNDHFAKEEQESQLKKVGTEMDELKMNLNEIKARLSQKLTP